MGYNCRLSLKNLGKSVKGRNLPYPFLRGEPLKRMYTRAPGSRAACDLTDFSETLPV